MARPLENVLVVDEPELAARLAERVRDERLAATPAAGPEALGIARSGAAVVVAPLRSPAGAALDLLAAARERDPAAQLVVTAAPEDLAAAVAALRAGACDVLARPVDPEHCASAVRGAVGRHRLHALLTAARLTSVSTLLGGVAHQLSNPVTSLLAAIRFVGDGLSELGRIDALSARGADPADLRALWDRDGRRVLHEVRGALADALESAERIGALAKDVGAVVHPDAAPETFDLCDAVGAALRVAGAEVSAAAHVELDLAPRTLVTGSPGRLAQCLIHLLLNAAQALAAAGRRGRVRVRVAREADLAIAEVSDDGPGVAPADAARIFEPFYSTRGDGAGLGLGLATCRAIAARHGGTLSVASEPGRGSTFTLRMPAAGPS